MPPTQSLRVPAPGGPGNERQIEDRMSKFWSIGPLKVPGGHSIREARSRSKPNMGDHLSRPGAKVEADPRTAADRGVKEINQASIEHVRDGGTVLIPRPRGSDDRAVQLTVRSDRNRPEVYTVRRNRRSPAGSIFPAGNSHLQNVHPQVQPGTAPNEGHFHSGRCVKVHQRLRPAID